MKPDESPETTRSPLIRIHMVEVVKVDPAHPEGEKLRRIADIIGRGGVIAYPTDTFYGLGCDPFNEAAVQRIVAIKGREGGKPILLIISDLSLVDQLTSGRNEQFERLSQRFWPGPLTLVLPASARLSSSLTAGTGTIGLRLPDHALCRRVVSAGGGVLTGTSANLAGQPSAVTAQSVLRQLGQMLDLVVDGGSTPGGAPSTVLDISRDPPRLLRQGAVSQAHLEELIETTQPTKQAELPDI